MNTSKTSISSCMGKQSDSLGFNPIHTFNKNRGIFDISHLTLPFPFTFSFIYKFTFFKDYFISIKDCKW